MGNKQKLILSILFLAASLAFASAWVGYTNSLYPDLVVSQDVLFEILPFVDFSVFSDTLSILGPILFLVFIFTKKKENKIPYYATVIGFFYLVRSFFIYVTPLANPFPLEKWGTGLFPTGGMFPSGHTGFLFLMFLFAKEDSRHWSLLFLAMALLEGAFMIISRGHYSIDIFGAMIVAYALHSFSEKHLQKRLVLNSRNKRKLY